MGTTGIEEEEEEEEEEYTQLGTTGNYSAPANLRTLQFTAKNTSVLSLLQSPLSISWQRILTQEL
jgi:hypothetical protein